MIYEITKSESGEIISATIKNADASVLHIPVDHENSSIICLPVGGSVICIPVNSANVDYQQYLAWIAEGNTAEEWSHNATI